MNNRNVLLMGASLLILGVFAVAFFGVVGTGFFGLSQVQEAPLKVGWQTAWAENGFVIESWKNTDVLEKNWISVEYVPFVTGVAMLEVAAAKKLDVMFVGTAVTAVLFSKSDDWVIVSRMAKVPISIIAGNQTGITDVLDLREKKIAVPFGSGPHAVLLQALKNNGLDHKKDVTIVNLKPTDYAQSLQTGAVDAVVWNTPSKETLESAGIGKGIYQAPELGVMLVSKDLVKNNPEKVRKLVSALRESDLFFAQNQDKVMDWYAKDSSLDLKLVKSIQKVELNYSAKSIDEINLGISDEEIVPIQERFDLLFKEGVISKPVIFKEHLDFNFLK